MFRAPRVPVSTVSELTPTGMVGIQAESSIAATTGPTTVAAAAGKATLDASEELATKAGFAIKQFRNAEGELRFTASIVDDGANAAAKEGTNLVYQGVDKAGVVRYVGITERDAAIRFGEHLNSGTAKSFLQYEVVPDAMNLSRTAARTWEQTLINQHGLEKNGGLLLNKINSIAPKNWWQFGL